MSSQETTNVISINKSKQLSVTKIARVLQEGYDFVSVDVFMYECCWYTKIEAGERKVSSDPCETPEEAVVEALTELLALIERDAGFANERSEGLQTTLSGVRDIVGKHAVSK